MKADAVNMPSTAVEVSGNRCCGNDNAMPGDFIMALMGVLLQQGSIEKSSGESPGGLFFKQGEVVSNLLPSVSVAGLEELSPQSHVSEIVSEILPGSENRLAGGKSMANLLLPSAGASDSGSGAMAPENISQPGQAASGVSLLGTAVSGQEASGAAQVLADGEMGANVQLLKGGETGINVQLLKGEETGVNVQLLKDGETGVNLQVDTGNSSGAKDQAVSTLQKSTVPTVVTGVITTLNNDEVLPDAAVPKDEAADYLPVKNSLPYGPAKNTGSVAGGDGKNQFQTITVVEEQTEIALPKMPDNKWEKASSITPTGRLTLSQGSAVQPAGYGRTEAVQGIKDASAAAGQVEDGAVEMLSITDSDGTAGKESDARPGGSGLHGDMQISTGTQLSNITGRKLAAEIIPYVLNSLKNSEGEKSRITVLRLKLEPENLGEIKIRLSFVKGELTAHFYTASGLVKDAVEGSLPQLRETLGQYNINLGEAGAYVGQEQQNRNGRFGGYKQGNSLSHAAINYPVSSAGDTGRSEPGYGSSALDLLI